MHCQLLILAVYTKNEAKIYSRTYPSDAAVISCALPEAGSFLNSSIHTLFVSGGWSDHAGSLWNCQGWFRSSINLQGTSENISVKDKETLREQSHPLAVSRVSGACLPELRQVVTHMLAAWSGGSSMR